MKALHHSLRRAAQSEMHADTAHDIAHLDRVWQTVQRIATGENSGNLKVLMAAAYLHDIVNLPKNSPDRTRASTMAADRAAEILTGLAFSSTDINSVRHAIIAHSFSAGIPPETIEAKILRDADRLDALGAIGIARSFAVAGLLGQTLYHPEDPFAANRDLDDARFSLDHWREKLLGLGDGLQTQTAREIAHRRLDYMQGYLSQLADEIGSLVPKSWR